MQIREGVEIFFNCLIISSHERNLRDVIDFGEIIFLPHGKVIVVRFGTTSISKKNEIGQLARHNLWGNTIINAIELKSVKTNEVIVVEKN